MNGERERTGRTLSEETFLSRRAFVGGGLAAAAALAQACSGVSVVPREVLGGKGRSLLIGGSGLDALVGGSAGDVLIGGRIEESDDEQLFAALNAWNPEDPYADRVDAINALFTAADDEDEDQLRGGGAFDLFFADIGDDLLGVKVQETVL